MIAYPTTSAHLSCVIPAIVVVGFVVWPLTAEAQPTITCERPVQGSLLTIAESDVFYFEGTAGDSIWLSISTTFSLDFGFQARVELRRPDGNWHTATVATMVSTLPATGRYTLRVHDGSTPAQLRRGDYALRLEWLGPSTRVCHAQPITCGARLANALLRVDEHLFQFDATSGDVIWLSITTTSDEVDAGFKARIELRRPDGTWHTSSPATSVVTLPVTGRYLVRVYDGSTTGQVRQGGYAFRLEWLGPAAKVCQARPIGCSTPFVDTLLKQDQDLYWFDAAAGDQLRLAVTPTAQSEEDFVPRVEIFRPDGRSFTSTLSTVDLPLPVTGRYLLRAFDYRTGAQQGGYYSIGFYSPWRCTPVESPPRIVRLVYLVPVNRDVNSNYQTLIERRAREFREWLRGKLIDGVTYQLREEPVEVYRSTRPDSYYAAQGDRGLGFWTRVYADAGAVAGVRSDDPDNVWVVYVDAANACGQLGGAGIPGVAILPRDDLLKPAQDVCKRAQETNEDRWTGGFGHELLHALGLLHPADCEQTPNARCEDNENAFMWRGYPYYPTGTHMRPDEVIRLIQSPAITPDARR